MAIWLYLSKYNPFHLPTLEQARTMGSFSEPPLLSLLDHLTFVLCPGTLLMFVTMDWGETANDVMWVVVALINAPVYYLLGLLIAALLRRDKTANAA
jgi:hypothetical protein